TAFTSVGVPNEHPIAFSKCAWANRIFDSIVINFKSAVGDELVQSCPSFQGVINRLSKQTLRQGFSPDQLHGAVQSSQHWLRLPCAHSRPQCRPAFLFAEFLFHRVKLANLPHKPC